jgi:hypothetical protein
MKKITLAVLSALALGACSDQGTVKPETSKQTESAPATRAQASPDVQLQRSSAGADTLPPGHPPIDQAAAPSLPAVPAGAGTGASALAWTSPATWIEEKPSSPMRRAQYKVPGPGGNGECVVFYFGPGQGGDPMSNAERWAGQFTLPDGSPAQKNLKTSEIEVGGFKVFIVEVAGTYSGGMSMSMEPQSPKPNYRLLGAVAPGPDANWYFKFTGPDATVNANRAAFESMVKSLKHGQTS